MCRRRYIALTQEQRVSLEEIREHDAVPHLRVKAAAVLKVADGHTIKEVATHGLLRPYCQTIVSRWITIYEQEGSKGWNVKAGRGRKAAFFPSVC
jgi:hypothetical protein